jgi:hypothetical protein
MSRELENVCIAVDVFHLSFTVPELLLLPVGGGHIILPCWFPVPSEVSQRRSSPAMDRLSGIYVDVLLFRFFLLLQGCWCNSNKSSFPDVSKTRWRLCKIYHVSERGEICSLTNKKTWWKKMKLLSSYEGMFGVGTDPHDLKGVRQKPWPAEG